jgi:uncharacterized protein YdeI (YjbR/CyaY-like superfamily)
MPKDSRIDAYIAKSADFARPILEHLRATVHKVCPDAQETMKWSFPHFDYKGEMMCSMAAFKHHAVFGFWKSALMTDPKKLMRPLGSGEGMGNFGKFTSLKELPPTGVLVSYIKEAMRLNDEGVKVKKATTVPKKVPKIPPAFATALKKRAAADRHFSAFPPGQKREYVEWVADAKQKETREKRIKQAVEWIAEGKYRNWKYMKTKKG